ncbi:helix-turn-helix domain-containing protein [Mesonia aquimarina]|uniref:helix-turn-helix domain-containing protein n=1 Tax=Mesonia aquimarina TaxID=1504967 RepID=UPI000EF5E6D9|nr:AraC family transcriptional regulator [Mesonia aquimarina]
MKNLYVKSLPLKDVIKDLAEELQGEVIKHCDEYIIEIPEAHGQGYVRGINFRKGIGVIEYDCVFKEDIHIHFSLSQIHPLKFIFCSKGVVKHSFEELNKPNLIETYQNALIGSSAHNGHVLEFEAGKRVHMNSLEIDREVFLSEFSCSLKKFSHPLKNLLLDVEAHKLFYYKGNYSLRTADLIQEMNTDLFSDFIRAVKLESQALEMLAVQIEQYEDDLKLDKNQQVLRKQEIEKIIAFTENMTKNLSVTYTVKEFANAIGININKLQEGFKYLYQDTVNNFIQKKRLEKAQDLLMNTECSIQEITEKIGLSNPSYFSKLFKERYNLTPNQFRKGKPPKVLIPKD